MGCSLWTQTCGLSVVIVVLFRGTGEGRERHTRLRKTRQKQKQRGESRACHRKWQLNMKVFLAGNMRKTETRQFHGDRKRNE